MSEPNEESEPQQPAKPLPQPDYRDILPGGREFLYAPEILLLIQRYQEPHNQEMQRIAGLQLREAQKSNLAMFSLVGSKELPGQLPQLLAEMKEMRSDFGALTSRVTTLETQREEDLKARETMHQENKDNRAGDRDAIMGEVKASHETILGEVKANRREIYRQRRTVVQSSKRLKRFLDSCKKVGIAIIAIGQDDSKYSAKKIITAISAIAGVFAALGAAITAAAIGIPAAFHKLVGIIRALKG